MSKLSREKGKRAEREVRDILRKYGFSAVRDGQQREEGHQDLIHNIPQVHLEVKRREKLCLPEWTKQAERDAKLGYIPVVAYRTNGEPWRASLPLEELVLLFSIKRKYFDRLREDA